MVDPIQLINRKGNSVNVKKNSANPPLVSIIIPVYNGERHIKFTLQSSMDQTYRNIEIIVVNDGSTDGSLSIIEDCQQIDNRILCLSKENEGLVLARKTGLSKASGKYIQHLDADDTLLPDAIERLARRAEETNADIVAAPFYFCSSGKEPKLSGLLKFEEVSGLDYYREILNQRAYWSVWSNFHKRSLYEDNPIQALPHVSFGEDLILITQLALYAHKAASIQEPILNYNQHETSMTYQMNNAKYLQLRMGQDWVSNYLDSKGLGLIFRKEMAQMHLQTTFDSFRWKQFSHAKQDMKKLIPMIDEFPDLISLLSRRERKLFSSYKKSPLLGELRLKYYRWKGKM